MDLSKSSAGHSQTRPKWYVFVFKRHLLRNSIYTCAYLKTIISLTMLHANGTFMTCVLVTGSHTFFYYGVNAILGHRKCSQTETSWFPQCSHMIHNYSVCTANWQGGGTT